MASAKIKCMKIMRIINDNAVRGRLSENYLTRKFEIFVTRNIRNLRYCKELRVCLLMAESIKALRGKQITPYLLNKAFLAKSMS